MQRVFAANRVLFETVEMASVAFDDREAADALCNGLREGRADFPAPIPENPQILDEPVESGYLGLVTRADLPPELAEAAFAERAGEFVGPVAYARRFWVCQILMARSVELNEAVYEWCEALLAQQATRSV